MPTTTEEVSGGGYRSRTVGNQANAGVVAGNHEVETDIAVVVALVLAVVRKYALDLRGGVGS